MSIVLVSGFLLERHTYVYMWVYVVCNFSYTHMRNEIMRWWWWNTHTHTRRILNSNRDNTLISLVFIFSYVCKMVSAEPSLSSHRRRRHRRCRRARHSISFTIRLKRHIVRKRASIFQRFVSFVVTFRRLPVYANTDGKVFVLSVAWAALARERVRLYTVSAL